jgi:hypothetical protein
LNTPPQFVAPFSFCILHSSFCIYYRTTPKFADTTARQFTKGHAMSVIVDQQSLPAEEMGLKTVGQVLSHLQSSDRLVVNLLIDGKQPNLAEINGIRKSLVMGKTLFIETANPNEMALEVLDDVQEQLAEAEKYKIEAAELLGKNQVSRAMEKLGVYFSTWQSAQESVLKTSQLLRLDLETTRVKSKSIAEILSDFTSQLREIRQTLVNRDFVSLTDLLLYETTETYQQWLSVLDAMRGRV